MAFCQQDFHLDIFQNSPAAYCVAELILDTDGHPTDWIYRYCNPAFAELKGYRLDDMINHSFLSLYPQIDPEWLDAYYAAAYENKISEMDLMLDELYHVVVVPAGQKGFCSCMIYAERNKKIEKNQDSLTEEKQGLKKLLPEYVSMYRIELNSGKYETLRLIGNTNARQLAEQSGMVCSTFDEYTEHYAENFILEEDREEFKNWHSCKNMKKLLCNTDKITYHYHSVSREGKDSYYEAYAVKEKTDDQTFQIFLGYRNIDSILYKERSIQQKLQEALEQAKLSNEIITAIAKSYQYISQIDIPADTFEEIINRDKTHLNFIRTGILSVNNKRVCRQDVAEEYQEAFLKFTDITTLPERMKSEESLDLEYRMKDGSWHKMRLIEKKRGENGCLTHALCAIRSISDTKKREQDLMYQVAEAKKDAALKSRFLSNMSHDIRTPMNGILGMLDLAERYPDDQEMQKRCRDKIRESSKYLVALVNDILDMNKLESETEVKQNIPFDLAELLNKVNTSREKMAANKLIDYVVNWQCSGIKHRYLIGNPLYVERILTIIADNAVKFTNAGGQIQVWGEEKTTDDRHVTYQFGCSDTGIGMSEEFVKRAFDMFSQENETSRSKYEGSGLGLAIAKKIADKLGGTIEIQSQKEKGTTVLITLTFKIGERIETEKPYVQGEVSLEGLRVLVAEDNELNMEIARYMLEENGMQVEGAVDGMDAVKKFQNTEPGYYDVICMDIMMPNLNGWDAARKIRTMKRADAEKIPIIAMSANAFTEDIIKSRISGMDQHVAKPLDMNQLRNVLKECVKKHT